jgi:crooked neck
VTDFGELLEHRLQRRKEFEDQVRRYRHSTQIWLKYALWESKQGELDRARSVLERALDVDYRHVGVWLKYAEMEMKHRNVNRARNVWDRAVSLLPRMDQLWLKYALMEEKLGQVESARNVFERWMKWAPEKKAWSAFIDFEIRQKQVEKARGIYERYVVCHPDVETYLIWAKFEEKRGTVESTRRVFEACNQDLGWKSETSAEFYVAFAKFEEKNKEFERAKFIYEFGLKKLRESVQKDEDFDYLGDDAKKKRAEASAELYRKFNLFQKQHGSVDAIDSVVLDKRRLEYEEELKQNSLNYDVWFDYIRLEQSAVEHAREFGDAESENLHSRIREVFERAIASVPPSEEKRFWRRYVYLWIMYAVYEEIEARDIDRAREVYKACLGIIPHKKFTFSKIWWFLAELEIRALNVSAARKTLGTSLGKCAKPKTFKLYIEMEKKLGEFDRVRTLYEKFIQFSPSNCETWKSFASFEVQLEEYERARAIFELAINQPVLDLPEGLWKAYIDMELELDEFDAVRDLYERLLERTKHVKVWISFAQFEASIDELDNARGVFKDAHDHFRRLNQADEVSLSLFSI